MQCLTNEIIFCGFRKHSLSGLQLQSGMQYVQRSDCRAANLQSFAAARHFCSAKILAGGLRWGWGPRRSRELHCPRKEISRGNLLCAKSGLPNLSYPPTRERSKVRRHTQQEHSQYRAAPGCQRDRGPFCFGKSPEEPLPRGSFGQLLRGGSTPRFFSQIRSVGSKPPGWQGTASQSPAPAATDGSKMPPAAALGSKNKKRRAAFAAPKP